MENISKLDKFTGNIIKFFYNNQKNIIIYFSVTIVLILCIVSFLVYRNIKMREEYLKYSELISNFDEMFYSSDSSGFKSDLEDKFVKFAKDTGLGDEFSALAEFRLANINIKNGKSAEAIKIYSAIKDKNSGFVGDFAEYLYVKTMVDSQDKAYNEVLTKFFSKKKYEHSQLRYFLSELGGVYSFNQGDYKKAYDIFLALSSSQEVPEVIRENSEQMVEISYRMQ